MRRSTTRKARLAPVLVAVIGLAFLALPLVHLLSEPEPPLAVAVGIAPPFALAGFIVGYAVHIRLSGTRERDAMVMVYWILAAAAFMAGGTLMHIAYQWIQGVRLESPLFNITNSATGGAVLGILIGTYYARQRQKSRALSEERERLNALFENVGSPSVMLEVVDGTPRVVRVNSVFRDLFGVEGDVSGDPLSSLHLPSEEEVMEDLRSRVCRREPCVREVGHADHGSPRYFLVQVTPFSGEEGRDGAFLTYIDITENKLRQQRLDVLNRVLRHDLRNKVNVVIGNAELLRGETDGEARERVEAIMETSEELVDMSDRIRAFEEGESEPVDLAAAVRSEAAEVSNRYPGVEVEVEAPEELWVEGGDLLDRALDGLMENAVEHNDLPQDERRVEVRARRDDDDAALLEVRDNGPGIPEEELDVLRRGEESALYHSEGIGLWIVKWILNRIGGNIEFEHLEPRGTAVTVRLRTVPRREGEA